MCYTVKNTFYEVFFLISNINGNNNIIFILINITIFFENEIKNLLFE